MVEFARSFSTLCLVSILISSAISAKCSKSSDCITDSPCTLDFCEPLSRGCVSIGSTACARADLIVKSRSAVLRDAEARSLNLTERLKIIFEARRMFRDLHPHRPLHLKFLKVNLVGKLRSFASEVRAAGGRGSVVAFHDRMIDIFQQAQDRHTVYSVPPPLKYDFAILPFQVREYYDPSASRDFSIPIPSYIVADVAAKAKFFNPAFEKGVKIFSWDGVSIREAVMTQGKEGYGSNRYAIHRLGLKSLTFKRLNVDRFPRQDDVEVGFISAAGKFSSVIIPWIFAQVPKSPDRFSAETPSTSISSFFENHFPAYSGYPQGGLDRALKLTMRQVRKTRFRETPISAIESKSFDARIIHTQRGSFGQIAIHNFLPKNDTQFLSEMRRVILQMPRRGLVFDLRGNDGGRPRLCQNIVQFFTKQRVIVTSTELRSSPLSLKLSRLSVGSDTKDPYLNGVFGAATRQADIADKFGDQYFGSYRILEQEANMYEGERYNAPVVVLIDAETYSCGDVFAAVVQDSGAAVIVGVDRATGGGGSATLDTGHLLDIYPSVFDPLPGNVSWSFSHFRITRGGKNEGRPIEYFGVKPDIRYYYTKADRLDRNRDLNLYLNDLLKKIGSDESLDSSQTPVESPEVELTHEPSIDAILV